MVKFNVPNTNHKPKYGKVKYKHTPQVKGSLNRRRKGKHILNIIRRRGNKGGIIITNAKLTNGADFTHDIHSWNKTSVTVLILIVGNTITTWTQY